MSALGTHFHHRKVALRAHTVLLERYVTSWHLPPAASSLRGMRLLADSPVPTDPAVAVTRAIVRANWHMGTIDALVLATHAIGVAEDQGLNPEFFCATLLQESAFAPEALSSAGAVGIAQFTIDTADGYGIDPFDWSAAMSGSAQLLGGYLQQYDGLYPDPYAVALAAYNAGPGAVAAYKGIPPYDETRQYIADVYTRWARLEVDTRG
jgi:soluble lytic murein transglycosylase-like protein